MNRSGKTGEGFQPGRFRQLKWAETYGGCKTHSAAAPRDMCIFTDHNYECARTLSLLRIRPLRPSGSGERDSQPRSPRQLILQRALRKRVTAE